VLTTATFVMADVESLQRACWLLCSLPILQDQPSVSQPLATMPVSLFIPAREWLTLRRPARCSSRRPSAILLRAQAWRSRIGDRID
jgi:hypothetical protein